MPRSPTPAEQATRELVASNLRAAMTWWTDMTATHLAERAQVSRNTVFNILGAHSGAQLDVLTRVAQALGIEVKDLFGTVAPYEEA